MSTLTAIHPFRKVNRVAKQVCRGMPFLQKEITRALSVRTDSVLATPQIYYLVYGSRCNAACTFCPVDRFGGPMLSQEVMLRLIRETRELSGKGFNISFSGGEPLIYPHLQDLLALAQELGVNFGFTTNGYLLTKANVADVLKRDPFNINVSVESVDPETNELLRPRKDGTRHTLEGIDNIVTEKRRTGSRVSVIIKSTIMEQNYRRLPELVRYFGQYPEVQVSFQPYLGPLDSGFWIKDVAEFERVVTELKELRQARHSLMTDENTLDGFVSYFRNPQKSQNVGRIELNGQKRGCDIAYRSLEIFADGSVQFCDLFKFEIGNVYKQSLKEMYYGDVARQARKRIAYCNLDCQRTCQRPIAFSTKVRAFMRMG